MSEDYCFRLVDDFLRNSWRSVEAMVRAVQKHQADTRKPVSLFKFENGKQVEKLFAGSLFFLRGSVEYANPQLTVEELQGIVGARLLEASGNYFCSKGLAAPNRDDVGPICELLKKPSNGPVVAFLLNTDDVEADRYSMNPLKTSIVKSGQSAFPAATVKTSELTVDLAFASKYEGTLICKGEIELIRRLLQSGNNSYLDFVDSVKFQQMADLSALFSIDLILPALRMPLATLQREKAEGMLHHIISECHRNFDSVSQAYECMGRSMSKRTTLLTVPHSKKGYGSKRAARGRLHFSDGKLESAGVKYKDTLLYPNAIDPDDVSVAKCEDSFSVAGEKLADYRFVEVPSSPQFFLYSLGSPEDAALWHGVGAFASPQLLQSYVSIRRICQSGQLIRGLQEKYGVKVEVPLQLNLAPNGIWVHPVHRNIDASVSCVKNVGELVQMGMRIEHLMRFG